MTNLFQKEFKTYLFTYRHDGAEWAIELQAENEADALARRAKLAYAQLNGELVAKIPHEVGWIAKLAVKLRNLFSFLLTRPNHKI